MKSLEEAIINALVNKINEDCIDYKMKLEYSNQKPEVPLTRRERRALKRKEKKYGEFRKY